ncbi:hypothetical protein L914_13770 [Phytophthora nicotianae]|uniref:Uncharacterized protein n=2 Tax=Phytophthora nicotianae TaxID=4792 RepID=V9E6V1_PHYNI|nr:hypothetical protein F443_18763 [Phytophthora nicotianae P1569]ETM40231.1 hypothetical protein L914_13770 [Phytophthora nicotianae]
MARLQRQWVECLRDQISDHHANEKQRKDKTLQIAKEIATVARTNMQGVAKDKVVQLQEKLPQMSFEMLALKRHTAHR